MTDDDDLRHALRDYATPGAVPPGGAGRVLAAVDRRRRRRTAVASVAAALVLVGGIGVIAGLARGGPERSAPAEVSDAATDVEGAPARWVEMPPSPLAPRTGSVGAWTGSELVVVGGTTADPCPPGADCAAPSAANYRRDGAAYDPASDSWRPIADLPTTFRSAQAVWSGDDVVVIGDSGAWAYDPDADRWRTLDAPPGGRADAGEQTAPVVTPAGIVVPSYDQAATGASPDLLLDPATGTWTRLPHDPFGESFDRSMAWDGSRLWLLSMGADEHYRASEGARSRLAVLEGGVADGRWRVVDDETPPLTYGQRLWWSGDRLVVTPRRGFLGFTYDIDRRRGRVGEASPWTEVGTREEPEGCALPAAGVGPAWVSGGGPTLVAASDVNDVVAVPGCRGLAAPDVAVWAGSDLLVWGGPSSDHSAGTATGYRSQPAESRPGSTAEPCPERLPMADRATYGFGTEAPATRDPDLPRPDQAWICSYSSRDVRPDNTAGAWYVWERTSGPVEVDDLDLLDGLLQRITAPEQPANTDGVVTLCTDELGPRYLVAFRSEDRMVGVVIDDYGCGDVRLTGDPATEVAGDGLVPGVLDAPPELRELARTTLR